MANDYQGSIAQNFVNFSVGLTIEARVGANFQSAMIFVKQADAATLLVAPPAVGAYTEITSANFADTTLAGLKDWFTEFYDTNSITTVYVVVFDGTGFPGATTLLSNVFATVKSLAFFKLLYSTVVAEQVAFAGVCATDTKTTQCWIGTSDVKCLTLNDAASIYTLLKTAGYDAVLDYHATAKNSAFAQLGLSLGFFNGTGFAVGNALDYKATLVFGASGTAGANLTAAQVSILTQQNIGYWATRGNGTGEVVRVGPKTIKGNNPGALWFAKFIEYVCGVIGAQYLTTPTANRYANNDTYQALLSILTSQVWPFINIGKISDFQMLAPRFAQSMISGDQITVPNAWSGIYNDNVRKVQIQGNLVVPTV